MLIIKPSFRRNDRQIRLPFTTRSSHDDIDVFDTILI